VYLRYGRVYCSEECGDKAVAAGVDRVELVRALHDLTDAAAGLRRFTDHGDCGKPAGVRPSDGLIMSECTCGLEEAEEKLEKALKQSRGSLA